jgi:hypothetical protein
MTAYQFRSSADRVGAMRELIQNSVLVDAIVCLKDERPSGDAPDHADALASVRLLSRQAQHDAVINLLMSLAEPLPPEPVEEQPDWGVDATKFKLQPK